MFEQIRIESSSCKLRIALLNLLCFVQAYDVAAKKYRGNSTTVVNFPMVDGRSKEGRALKAAALAAAVVTPMAERKAKKLAKAKRKAYRKAYKRRCNDCAGCRRPSCGESKIFFKHQKPAS